MDKSKFMKGGQSAGDPIKLILADHFEYLHSYIQMKLLDMPELVDDVLMETVERVMNQGSSMPQKDNLTVWILGVARMTCKEFRRVESGRRRRHLSLDAPTSDDADTAQLHPAHGLSVEHPADEMGAMAHELITLVLDSKTLLTERERAFFRDYYVADYSLEELAQKYGLAKQTVYNTLYQCRRKIRTIAHRIWDLK